ncbi:hypothetical protein C8R43DRAFT_1019101 [Mycena crocata]|nr:hypothetical protein C8R43DRAFT_1019101 [Mycena crocata]
MYVSFSFPTNFFWSYLCFFSASASSALIPNGEWQGSTRLGPEAGSILRLWHVLSLDRSVDGTHTTLSGLLL